MFKLICVQKVRETTNKKHTCTAEGPLRSDNKLQPTPDSSYFTRSLHPLNRIGTSVCAMHQQRACLKDGAFKRTRHSTIALFSMNILNGWCLTAITHRAAVPPVLLLAHKVHHCACQSLYQQVSNQPRVFVYKGLQGEEKRAHRMALHRTLRGLRHTRRELMVP